MPSPPAGGRPKTPAGGRPKADPALLEKALRLVELDGLTPTEASEQLQGRVSKTTIYDELRRRAAAKVADASGQPLAVEASPAAAPPRARDGTAAPPEAPAGEGDDLAIYDQLIRETKRRVQIAEPARYSALTTALCKLMDDRRKLAPPKPKTDEEKELEARAFADDVVRKLQQSIVDAEARAQSDGRCAHCGQLLETETDEAS